ncbi:hypothetical protein R1sor_016166 [Riccia sorocarpa]|uniref:ABC transporter domain-containing protein n=1 Tax=Riccia sorocarpa TaxID=122646 RepID=A0ABD3HGZ1_9MARC
MADFVPPRRSTSFRRNASFREKQIFPVSESGDWGSSAGPRASTDSNPIAGPRASTDSNPFAGPRVSTDSNRILGPIPSTDSNRILGGSRGSSDSNSSATAASRRFHAPSFLLRSNSVSVAAIEQAIAAEVANAEASMDPSELLPEALGDWRHRSMGMQMLKRNQTLRSSKRSFTYRDPSSRVYVEGLVPHSGAAVAREVQPQPQPSADILTLDAPRHRYFVEEDSAVLAAAGATDGKVDEVDKDKQLDIPEDLYSALNVAPQATLVHLVRLYHKTLVEHGLQEDAQKIADMLADIEALEEEEEEELTGVDLLLKNGLLKYMMRIQPYLPPIPPQVVHFRNLNCTVTVQIDPGYESIHTQIVECAKGPFKESKQQKIQLLKDATGYVMPGTLTLVIGGPACGKTVMPKILAGRAVGPGSIVEGQVTYNGQDVHSVNYQRLVAFVEPQDYHYPSLTVRETMEFARDCTQYYKPKHFAKELKEMLGDVLKTGQEPKLETNLRMLGLKRVEQKPVGNAQIPTLTANEIHRVSVCEMVVGTYALYVFDSLNEAIDDALAVDLINAIRIFTRVRKTAVIASLAQPSPEVVGLFDRLIVLNRGVIVYQGPRQDALPYFESLGYFKPNHVSIAEFLEEVADPEGVQYLQAGFPRLNLDGFEAAYKDSDCYRDICRVLDSPELLQEYWMQGEHPLGVNIERSNPAEGDKPVGRVASIDEKPGSLTAVSMNHTDAIQTGDELVAVGGLKGQLEYVKMQPSKLDALCKEPTDPVRLQFERPHRDWEEHEKYPQFRRVYVQKWWPEFWLLFKREVAVTRRNKLGLIIRAVQVLVLGLLMGFLFFRVKRNANQYNMGYFRGVTFVTLLDMTLFSLSQLPGLFQERPIYYKQQGAHFFRPSTYLLAKICGSFIFSLVEATAWTFIVYFLTNLSLSEGGWHFWVFYAVIVLTVLHGSAMVRCLSALLPDPATASGVVGLLVAIFILFAGFLLPRHICPKYWIWAYYIDPLQWGITALLINEFNSNSYKVLCRDVADLSKIPQCATRLDSTIGHAYLEYLQFYTDTKWIGVGIAVIIGWILLWTAVNYYALVKLRHKAQFVVTPAAVAAFTHRRIVDEEQDVELASNAPPVKLSLSAIPVTLSWHELSYNFIAPTIRKEISILQYISGWASPGEMVAILGGAGSGKTTLLNCLAGRKVIPGRISGQILVNGYPRNQAAFARVAGYVDPIEGYQQFVTVREAVTFSAGLNAQTKLTPQEISKFVDEILELMRLGGFADTLIKSLGKNYLSVADARRVMIAAELGRNPSIIFMDEPFKLLASAVAFSFCQTLKNVADTGRTVIAALQMPSQRAFGQFNSVQILKRGGELVYFGAVGKYGELVKAYFDSIPGTPICPQKMSTAHYILDIIGDGAADRKAAKDYAFEYRTSDLALHNHIQLQRVKRSKGKLGAEVVEMSQAVSFLTSGRYIFRVMQRYYWRNLPYSWGRITTSIILAVLLGSVYWDFKYDTVLRTNIRASSLYITTLLLAITNINAALPQFLVQRQSYVQEKARARYFFFWYAFSFSVSEFEYLAVSTFLNSLIFCLMAQMAVDTAANFFLFWFVVLLLTIALTFMGIVIASVGVPQISSVLVTIVIGALTSTSGVVIPKLVLHPQGVWLYWINPIQYALNSLTSIAFYCDVNSSDCMDSGRNPSCLTNQLACPRCDCHRLRDSNNMFVWSRLKATRTLDHGRIGYDILALVCFALLFRTMTVFIWRYRDAKAEKSKGA